MSRPTCPVLAPELWHHIIDLASDSLKLREMVQLRRVSRLFAYEALSAIARHDYIRRHACRIMMPRTCGLELPWHQNIDPGKMLRSQAEFFARLVFMRLGRRGSPGGWGDSYSDFVNAVVDAVLRNEGKPADHADRWAYVRRLCEVLPQNLLPLAASPWPRNTFVTPIWAAAHCLPGGQQDTENRRPWRGVDGMVDTLSFEQQVFIAEILLGKLNRIEERLQAGEVDASHLGWRSALLGGLVASVIRSGCHATLSRLLSIGEQGNDVRSRHLVDWPLTLAVRTRNLKIVELVCAYLLGDSENLAKQAQKSAELAMAEAIRLGDEDDDGAIFAHILSVVEARVGIPAGGGLPILYHNGLREACIAGGREELIGWLLDRGHEWGHLDDWALDCCATPVELASRAGHAATVRLLLARGLDPGGRSVERGPRSLSERESGHPHATWRFVHVVQPWDRHVGSAGSMMAAAAHGHVDVAELLVRDGGLRLSPTQWKRVGHAAVESGQAGFLSWMLDCDVVPRWRKEGQRQEEVLAAAAAAASAAAGAAAATAVEAIAAAAAAKAEAAVAARSAAIIPAAAMQKHPDLMGHVAVWGTPEMLPLLTSRGFSLEGPVFAQGFLCQSVMLAAMMWSRQDMVQALVRLGVPTVDSYRSSVANFWFNGYFPRRPTAEKLGWKVQRRPFRIIGHADLGANNW